MGDRPFRLLDQMSGHQLLDLTEDLSRIVPLEATMRDLLQELTRRGFSAMVQQEKEKRAAAAEKESRVQRAPDTAVSL